MPEVIAYCGLNCRECDAFIPTQTNDFELNRKIAERWTKGLNVEFKPGDIECKGCMSSSRIHIVHFLD